MRIVLILLLVIGLYDALALAVWYWPGRTFDSATSGVWATLATDFANGILYRPVLSEDGYGGTRYMPVFFMLYGVLVWLIPAPTVVGVVLMQATVLAMIGAIVAVLRSRRVGWGWAIGIALATYCTTIYQQYLTDVNAEYLAAGLSLWGLWLFRSGRPDRLGYALGICLFALAFLTKFTTLYVPAALFFSWIIHGRWRDAVSFAAACLAVAGGIGALVQIGSGGEFLTSLTLTATGGASPGYAAGFLRRFATEIFVDNPAIGVCFVVALWVWLGRLKTDWHSPLLLAFVLVTLITAITYTSPGIAGNHVIPLNAVCLLVIGTGLRHRLVLTSGFAVMALIVVATWLPGVPSPYKTMKAADNPTMAEIRGAYDTHVSDTGTLFSFHPMYAIVAGQRPFLMDAFNLNSFLARNHLVGLDFQTRIRTGFFDALIVKDSGRFLPLGYQPVDGQGTYLEQYYEAVDTLGKHVVMVRKAKE